MIGIGIIFAALAFEASVQEAKVETECLQEGLTNRCSLVQYSSLVRMRGLVRWCASVRIL